jgi:hypothetical protein
MASSRRRLREWVGRLLGSLLLGRRRDADLEAELNAASDVDASDPQ